MNKQHQLTAFAAMFQTNQRANGDTFVCLRDDAPQWATDLIREAHLDELPDDWTYQTIVHGAEELAAYCRDEPNTDLTEHVPAVVEGMVDIYNTDLIAWLALRPITHMVACNEAIEAWGAGRMDIAEIVSDGQHHLITQILSVIANHFDNGEEE